MINHEISDYEKFKNVFSRVFKLDELYIHLPTKQTHFGEDLYFEFLEDVKYQFECKFLRVNMWDDNGFIDYEQIQNVLIELKEKEFIVPKEMSKLKWEHYCASLG